MNDKAKYSKYCKYSLIKFKIFNNIDDLNLTVQNEVAQLVISSIDGAKATGEKEGAAKWLGKLCLHCGARSMRNNAAMLYLVSGKQAQSELSLLSG